MKNQLNKILKITLVILFFTFSKSYAIEDVSEFTDAISEASEKFNNLSEGSAEQSKIIDEAIKEIDKAAEYVQEAINSGNAEDAIKTLEFIEKSLSDVEKIIPEEFSSDMTNIDTSSIAKEDMDLITDMTTQMGVAKEEKDNEFMSDLIDLNLKGIDTVSISENLNGLGVKTIELVLDVEGAENLEKWTKQQWADSYKGDILTSVGDETITDKDINSKVVDLEKQLQTNNSAILDKRNSLTELQTKIDPLSNQITGLQTQKSSLLAKYNEEILKQSSTILSDEEIGQSKELADQFNKQLSDIANEIKAAEEQSNSLQLQVQGLNLELTNEIASKAQLENNIKGLSSQLSANQNVLSQKTSELNQLKNIDLNIKVNSLNEQLQYASRERDFIESDFEKSIDLEVDALARYYTALGDVDSEDFDKQIDFSMREVGVIMDADPRKARAFEIEKYATYAGLSNEKIQNGINAVNNDDWDAQKKFYKEITKSLAKNPDWVVDVPSNAELNVMMEEEKAIQAAALASMEVDKIKSEWNAKINEEVKDIQPLAALNLQTIKSAATWEGMKEHVPLQNEINKILSSTDLTTKLEKLEVVRKDYNETSQWLAQAGLLRYSTKFTQEMEAEYSKMYSKNAKLTREYFPLMAEVNQIKSNAGWQARENLAEMVVQAKEEYNEIISQENPELKAVEEKVTSILKEVPTFEADAENLAGLDATTLRARLVDITNGNNNESRALSAARDAVSKIGNAPIGNLTGVTWQMTNVKAAAIVRSKKYSYVDDYAYIQAEYGDPLSLNSAQREELEGELKNVLSRDNIKLQALNAKVTELSNELNFTKEQSQNITTEMAKLENELSSLKISEDDLQSQISNLTNQYNSKESLISKKNQNLSSLQEQLNPIGERMNALQGQRSELDGKLNDQLNTIADQVKDQGQVSDEANALKAEFESQIAELDNQIKEFENQSNEINSQLTTITTELSVLETENPELANQIASLNKDLDSFKDLKADLAMATAKKLGINVDDTTLKSVKVIDGKVVVALEGTNLVSVVDKKMLVKNASEFIDSTTELSINTKIYSADALNRELITPEFVQAAKTISASAKIDVIAQASAIESIGATTEQSAKYASAKAKRLAARKDWDAAMKSGDKAAEAAAEAAFMSARDIEQAAGQAAASAAMAASTAAQSATTQVASAAKEATDAATEAASQVQDVVASAQSAQQAALSALQELESLPGAKGFHSQEVQAAIEQVKAEMEGRDFSYMGYSSYEAAMKEIERMEKTGKSVVQCLSNKNGGKGEGC
ncbi:hypothetical protein N9W25_02030 [Candidatus Pelagibacter bacterium]|nr:hypothetical protein [Candidatus Pelagibacter bacterium]